jgi:iron complex transport system permease protein
MDDREESSSWPGLRRRRSPPSSAVEGYHEYIGRKVGFLVACAASLVLLTLYAMTVGALNIPIQDVVDALINGDSEMYGNIIWNIRMPRVFVAVLAGASLAIAGAVMQSVLRNPLASPYTLGLSQSAAFGASFAIVILGAGAMQSGTGSGIIVNSPYVVTICAFLGAMLGMVIITVLSTLTKVAPEAMVLAGVAIGSLFGAGITALQYFANDVQISSIVYWSFGDLSKCTWNYVSVLLLVCLPLMGFFIYQRWNFNAIDAGEETAKSLGVNVSRTRMISMLCASLLTAVVVALIGIIGFIGLLAPHMVRRLIGGDNRFLIPGSALVGGMLLMGADTIARTVVSPLILPVGIVTSFLGGPLFIYLLIRGYHK